MITSVRSALHAARVRRAARQLADVSFQDGRAEICDSPCRAEAHRRRVQTSVLTFGPH
ncbi:hypothetical protein ABZ135_32560 [Streptomyces sp. NPDC006339]|uniref:hypothetical protein n=1 Tax=Streptomyces sp. NPDC006339 TaxID=3156755 RepID=UPI0033B2752D